MFLEFFDFFCNCINQVFEVMKQFTLFRGFNFYHFAIFLMAIPIIFKLISLIFGIEDEEMYFGSNSQIYTSSDAYLDAYDKNYKGYIAKHAYHTPKHGPYIPKHRGTRTIRSFLRSDK